MTLTREERDAFCDAVTVLCRILRDYPQADNAIRIVVPTLPALRALPLAPPIDKRAAEALIALQELTGSDNKENPWLGVVSAVALLCNPFGTEVAPPIGTDAEVEAFLTKHFITADDADEAGNDIRVNALSLDKVRELLSRLRRQPEACPVPEAPRWIPVGKMLPVVTERERFLVTRKCYSYEGERVEEFVTIAIFDPTDRKFESEGVTHWQDVPLPEGSDEQDERMGDTRARRKAATGPSDL
jgi:hypothetical protein